MIDKSKYVRTENTKNLVQSPRKKDLKMKKRQANGCTLFILEEYSLQEQ